MNAPAHEQDGTKDYSSVIWMLLAAALLYLAVLAHTHEATRPAPPAPAHQPEPKAQRKFVIRIIPPWFKDFWNAPNTQQ